jgi:teichuronic acid biosynthesis glycosyltransferase TuaG
MKSLDVPRVSVIIPAFNMEQHIGETLDSLARQTFVSFEAIIVDDCSTDRTASIVQDRAAVDPRIRYIRMERNSNRPAVPRNRGLAEARGEFVAFLDHDDLWFERKLERQIRVLDSRPDLALVHSYLWEFTENSRFRGLVHLPNPLRRRASYETLRKHNVVLCSSAVARLQVLRDLGGFDERPELRTVEDYQLWLRLGRNNKLGYLSEVHGYYRWSRTSTSRQENWLEKHTYLDEQEGTVFLASQPSRMWQVSRKIAGYPLALYFHLVEAKVRQIFGKLPRVW